MLVVSLGSLAAGTLAQLAGLPAAWLVAPMFVAVIVALAMPGKRPEVPVWTRLAAQAVVGCVLAASFVPAIMAVVIDEWPAVALALCGTLSISLFWCVLLIPACADGQENRPAWLAARRGFGDAGDE